MTLKTRTMNTKNWTIGIAPERCILCGKCVRVCPAGIFFREEDPAHIGTRNVESCIACGHCAAACPTGAVEHSLFPPQTLHPIDYASLPSPEQMLSLIRARRSNRALTARPIPTEWLERIVEAARCAPTASNSQQVRFTLVTDAVKLRQVGDMTVDVFDSVARRLDNPIVRSLLKPFLRSVYAYLPAFRRLKCEHEAGNDPILRKATALLVIHTPASSRFGCEDANLACQNASLMAQSLGVSQIYMGFVLTAIRQGAGKRFAQITGAEGKVHAILALGIPAFQYPKYMDR